MHRLRRCCCCCLHPRRRLKIIFAAVAILAGVFVFVQVDAAANATAPTCKRGDFESSSTIITTLTTTRTKTTDHHNRANSIAKKSELEPWQECSIFIAPSTSLLSLSSSDADTDDHHHKNKDDDGAAVSVGGYGVFAGRNFEEHEIVELAPFFLPAEHDSPYVINTALQDYIYGYWREPGAVIVVDDQQQEQEQQQEPYTMSVIVWGMTMMYNHHPQSPNIKWVSFGHEPAALAGAATAAGTNSSHHQHHHLHTMGFIATRPIRKGEELFISYGIDDGGMTWFKDRNLTMSTPPPPPPEPEEMTTIQQQHHHQKHDGASSSSSSLEQLKQLYCSKMYADVDDYIFTRLVQPIIDPPQFYHPSRLAPATALSSLSSYTTTTTAASTSFRRRLRRRLRHRLGRDYHDQDDTLRAYAGGDSPDYPWAIAKVPIANGERIELAPALVLDRNLVIHTPLASLVYYWNDLNDALQESVRDLRRLGYFVVQHQSAMNEWKREDHFRSFEESVILPVGGWIGRIQRVGSGGGGGGGGGDEEEDDEDEDDEEERKGSNSNCYMRILPANVPKTAAAVAAEHELLFLAESQETVSNRGKKKEEHPFALGNAGIVLELIASRDVAVGERIRINLPPPSGGTFRERLALYKEMERSGQII